MDTPVKTTEKPILLNLAERLIEAQREVDELTLQLTLGKAEAKDKYAEIKSEFNKRLVNFKYALTDRNTKGVYKDIIARLEQMEARLYTGTAESRELFIEERKFILKALRTLEAEFRKRLLDSLDVQQIKQEIEVFKLKLEILHLKFVLKRFTLSDELKSDVTAVSRRVSIVIEKARKRIFAPKGK
jgi:hypothetical protein